MPTECREEISSCVLPLASIQQPRGTYSITSIIQDNLIAGVGKVTGKLYDVIIQHSSFALNIAVDARTESC